MAFVLIFESCKSSDNKKESAIARVYDEYLYKSDIMGIVPEGTSKNDSISIVKNYINNWIKQRLVLKTAESNLTSEQKNFEEQIQNYKNSLIVFTYEKELMKQKLDTNITDEEIKTYYENNRNNFLLKDNIVKVWYVKMPLNSSKESTVKQYYKSDKVSAKALLEDCCKKYAVNYFLDDSTWLYFSDLLKEIPITTYNQEDYLKSNRFIEMKDSIYSYFINIKGFQIKESISPLSLEKDNIRKIILNKKKLTLIEEVEGSIFKDAMKNKDFEIF
ncbi:MAG TPA: hypothetical protein PKK00_02630 [Bacteroidales bacterium]|nr:hypothetical protein [Bacteroidales bacterium]HPS15631.1 hypothetical protein [Bacteroidales bacterium]